MSSPARTLADEPGFVLFPGFVRSMRDGGVHWVGARQLIARYMLPQERCVIARRGSDNSRLLNGRVALGPRARGDYRDHLMNRVQAYQSERRDRT